MTTSSCLWMATTRWCSALLSPFPLLLPLLLFPLFLGEAEGENPKGVATGCGGGLGEEAERPSYVVAAQG
jgi:hypothetical protein